MIARLPQSDPLVSLVWKQPFERINGLMREPSKPVVANADLGGLSMRRIHARAASATQNDWVISMHLTETCSEEEAVHLILQAEVTAATVQDVELIVPLLPGLSASELMPTERLRGLWFCQRRSARFLRRTGDRVSGSPQRSVGMVTLNRLWAGRSFGVDGQKQLARLRPLLMG